MPVLRGINSNSIDLIYLDPPFNKGKAFHAPIGTSAEGASFHDIWSPDEVKDEWHNQINDRFPELYKYLDAVGEIGSKSAKYYLIYMAVRLIEMKRVLKDAGSLYLHCDPTASHYLKLLLDTIFGHKNFRNEVVWSHQGSWIQPEKRYPRRHDTLFYYGKSDEFTFNKLFNDDREEQVNFKRWRKYISTDGIIYGKNMPSHDKRFSTYLKAFQKEYGRDPRDDDPVLEITGSRIGTVQYIKVVDPKSEESVSYPTQKPLELLERIIKTSSSPDNLVLDPFCGCATTCIAAEKLDRQWIGIDVSEKAYDLVKVRLKREVPPDLFRGEPVFRKDRPVRTDVDYKKTPTKEDKKYLYGDQNGYCAACQTKFEIQHLEIDHIVPRSQGGGHERENLQLLCSNCNRRKGNRPMEYLMARLKVA